MKLHPISSAPWTLPRAIQLRPIRRPALRRIAGLVLLWVQRHRTRRALAALDPDRLADVGIGLAQARREVRKPFWRE
jgi:uncharacterized protein YjiS (DUF1127 family)